MSVFKDGHQFHYVTERGNSGYAYDEELLEMLLESYRKRGEKFVVFRLQPPAPDPDETCGSDGGISAPGNHRCECVMVRDHEEEWHGCRCGALWSDCPWCPAKCPQCVGDRQCECYTHQDEPAPVQPPAPDPTETCPTCGLVQVGRSDGRCRAGCTPAPPATTGPADEAEGLAAALSDIDKLPNVNTYQRQAEHLLASDWLRERDLARDAALRADIARDIKAHADLYAGPNRRGVFHDGYRAALEDAARIALGGTDE